MENPYQFIGTSHPYRKSAKTLRWGDFFVTNEKRSQRRQPLHPASCPFCEIAAGKEPSQSGRRVTFAGDKYLVVQNNNPIVAGQCMLIPEPAKKNVHRLDLNATDVKLALQLARTGFEGMLRNADDQPWACYVNAFPGTGRSVAHLHINCVPANRIPRLSAAVFPWQICTTANGGTISRLADGGFYAIAVEHDDAGKLADAVAELHARMNVWQQPYNFLAYPAGEESGAVRLLLVPRDSEYCEAADQRVAGLEFMTGVLIPGAARMKIMDTVLRDRALSQATLKGDGQLHLERQLRTVYGLPPAGRVVRARPHGKEYRAVAETNDVLEKNARGPASRGDKKPVVGKIDARFWVLPSGDPPQTDFHSRRFDANVLVRITRASICQSDRRVLGNKKKAEVDGLALGHEGGGYIVDPGPWESELHAGDKVVVLPHLSCGDCPSCHRYMSNLCPDMKHLGFDLNGLFADLMPFPYQCVLPVGADFPDDALPLVEPLACVLRALFRIREPLRRLADDSETPAQSRHALTIFGAGPMGSLTALAVRRNWPAIHIRLVEPNASRRNAIARLPGDYELLANAPPGAKSGVSFIACSNFDAITSGIETTEFGGTVLLFAGINTDEQSGATPQFHGNNLEQVHRQEQSVLVNYEFDEKRVRLIGSSGYILDDVKRSLLELRQHYKNHYSKVQNAEIRGLGRELETLLAPLGVDDPAVAPSLKVLIRL